MSDLLASKLREEVFTAIRAYTAATVAEAEAATFAIIRLVGNAAALDAARGESADERQAAIVAAARSLDSADFNESEYRAFQRVADWIESGEWRR